MSRLIKVTEFWHVDPEAVASLELEKVGGISYGLRIRLLGDDEDRFVALAAQDGSAADIYKAMLMEIHSERQGTDGQVD